MHNCTWVPKHTDNRIRPFLAKKWTETPIFHMPAHCALLGAFHHVNISSRIPSKLNILLGLSTSGRNSDILFNVLTQIMIFYGPLARRSLECEMCLKYEDFSNNYSQNENVLIDKDVYDIA